MIEAIKLDNYRNGLLKADIDKGYERVAHGITNALANPPVNLSGREYKVIHAVIAKTYRYQKKVDWISSSQLSEITGIDSSNISKIKKGLLAKSILFIDGRKIGINTEISEWGGDRVSRKQLTNKQAKTTNGSSKTINASSNTTNRLVGNDPHNKKETINKKFINKKEVFLHQNDNKAKSCYAFQGETIKINFKDFERMKKLYPNLSLQDELPQLDFELRNNEKWYSAMNAKLNYRNNNTRQSYQKSNQGSDWMDGAI